MRKVFPGKKAEGYLRPRDAAEKSNHKEHEDFSRRTRRSLFIYHSFFVLFAPFLRDLCG